MFEYMKVIVFLNRVSDGKDFNESVICYPTSEKARLEAELNKRAEAGKVTTVQLGSTYVEGSRLDPTPKSEVDSFLAKIDKPLNVCPMCDGTGYCNRVDDARARLDLIRQVLGSS